MHRQVAGIVGRGVLQGCDQLTETAISVLLITLYTVFAAHRLNVFFPSKYVNSVLNGQICHARAQARVHRLLKRVLYTSVLYILNSFKKTPSQYMFGTGVVST